MRSQQVLDGRYRLDDRLGAGGMSVVWRAHDLVLQRPVAVKVLANRHAVSVAARQRIRAEARAAARLWHPHVTGVFDYGEATDGGAKVPYVVMELLPGRTLAQRLEDGPLPPRVALRTLSEVASALAAAHAQDLVHRDVKPSNVMLTPSGAKVVDFGIAAVVGRDELESDGLLLGTPAYLAPERLTLGQVSPASDVYALGLLIYRALTDRLPWEADTTTQMIDAHVYVEPDPLPPIPDIPAEVNAICDRCLAKEPADRPSAAEVATVLAGAAGIVPPQLDNDPALAGLVAAMDATTQAAAAAAPVTADVVDTGRPAVDPELTTEVVRAAPARRPDRRRRTALLTAAGAALVVGAVVAALVVPDDPPTGIAGGAGASVTPAVTTSAPPDPSPTRGTPTRNTPTGGDDQGTAGSGNSTTDGDGAGGAEATRDSNPGSGSGSGSDPGTGDGGGGETEAPDPGPTPGRSVQLGVLGIGVTARCVGDQVEVLEPADHRSGPQNRVTITVLAASVTLACRNGMPSVI
ncbi:serine/threonine-protein kinase [Asanoa sp. NPDC050611]|uniref:serine/threonine-protein kinase n=1 Tax=Asanoa sp. NPDC050611 TaxID=3157098 RepID=UPI0033D289D1